MDPEDIQYIDALIDEYLVFRGFTKTKQTFKHDQKLDKLKGFEAAMIAKELMDAIKKYDMEGFMSLWTFLNETFFIRADNLKWNVEHFELSLKRYYVVNAIQTQRIDKCNEFFMTYGAVLAQHDDWRPWFGMLEEALVLTYWCCIAGLVWLYL